MQKLNPKHRCYDEIRQYFFTGKYLVKEIAEMTGVSERTIRNWVKDGSWLRLRDNANLAPAAMLENYINQLTELQNYISSREPGRRFPTAEEAIIQRNLQTSIIRMREYPAQMIASFSAAMVPVSDLVSEGEPRTEMETYQEPFQVPLRSCFVPYESEGINVFFSVDPNFLDKPYTPEDSEFLAETDKESSEQAAAESGNWAAKSGNKAATGGNKMEANGNEKGKGLVYKPLEFNQETPNHSMYDLILAFEEENRLLEEEYENSAMHIPISDENKILLHSG